MTSPLRRWPLPRRMLPASQASERRSSFACGLRCYAAPDGRISSTRVPLPFWRAAQTTPITASFGLGAAKLLIAFCRRDPGRAHMAGILSVTPDVVCSHGVAEGVRERGDFVIDL